MEQLYSELKAALLATGIIKTVQVYSNQINKLTAAKNTAGVVGFPAVLVEFTNIRYVTLGDGQQQYTALVRLYTVCFNLDDVGAKVFSTMRIVHSVAQGFYTDYTTGLVRIADDTDNDFTNTIVNITDYQFRGWEPAPLRQTATIDEINIHGEVRYIL